MTPEELNRRVQQALDAGHDPNEVYRRALALQSQTQKPKTGFRVSDLIPTATGIIGGVVGSVAGPGGTVAGGAAGSAIGEAIRQSVAGEDLSLGKIATEGVLGGVGGGVGKAGSVAARAGKQAIGKSLTRGGEAMAVRALRPTKTQLANFATQHGEDILPVIRRYKLEGIADPAKIFDDVIDPIQEQFDAIVKNTKVTVPREVLDRNFYGRIKTLLDSGDVDDVKVAEKILNQYESILGKKANLTIDDVNSMRKNFDSKVKDWKLSNPLVAGEKKIVADSLRDTIREVAESAGLQGAEGQSLRELGQELSKLYDIHTIANLQQNLGRGTLPLGLTTLLGAVGGGSVGGGLPGAVTMAAGTAFLNSPKTVGVLSRMALNAGDRLTAEQLAQGAGKTMARNVSSQIAGQAATRAVLTPSGESASTPDLGDITSALPTADSSTDPSASRGPILTQEEQGLLLLEDLAKTGGKNIDKLQTVFSYFGGQGTDTTKLSDAAIKEVSDLQAALTDLGNLSQTLQSNTRFTGPVRGAVAAANPFSDARKVQAEIDRVRQVVGKALEGGVLRKEDEEKYRKILPTINDTPELAQAKIQSLNRAIQDRMLTYINLQNTRGGGVFSLPTDTSQVQFTR